MSTVDGAGNIHSSTTGEFTGHIRAEADASAVLAMPAPEVTDPEDPVDFNRTRAHIARLARVLDRQTGKTEQDNALDLEDTIQEIHLRLLQAKANGLRIRREDAMVNTLARTVFREVGPMRMTTEDRSAILRLGRWRAAFLAENGREATSSEVAAEATRMRDEWPDPRHRPSKGFHLWAHGAMNAPTSIYARGRTDDKTETTSGLTIAAAARLVTTDAAPSPYRDGEPNWTEIAEGCTDSHFDGGNKLDARVFLTAGMAQSRGIPTPSMGTLREWDMQRARRTVANAGGVAAVLEHVRRGNDTPGTEALFTPWAGTALSQEDRHDIADLLGRMDPEVMWSSALRFALVDNQERIGRIVDRWNHPDQAIPA